MASKRTAPVEDDNASNKRTKTNANSSLPRSKTKTTQTTLNEGPKHRHKVFAFGEGTAGELGFGNVRRGEQAKAPRYNSNLDDAVSVVAGGMHSLAVTSAGQVLSWGGNDDNALGRDTAGADGDSDDEPDDAPGLNPREATPTTVHLPSNTGKIVQVAAGDSCSFALTQDGHVFGWGTFRNRNDIYGFTYDTTSKVRIKHQTTPALIPGLQNIVQICAGADFAMALDKQGRVYAWGPNSSGECGHKLLERRHVPDEYLLPHSVALPRGKFVSISAGLTHAFAINAQGKVWAWGLNNYGQTGIASGAGGNDPIISMPRRVQSLPPLRAVAGGAHHSVAVAQDGKCLVWGRIDGFQTGLPIADFAKLPATDVAFDDNGQPRILLKPSPLPIPACVTVAAGTDHSIAVTKAGKAYSWGFNTCAQCGQGHEEDAVEIATLMEAKSIVEEKIVLATAGGQFSMIGASQA